MLSVAPEKWDRETWLRFLKLGSQIFLFGAAVLSGSGGIEKIAGLTLRGQESDVVINTRNEGFGDYISETYGRQMACDAVLEAFANHRDDDRDWAHVLDVCHSEGAIDEKAD